MLPLPPPPPPPPAPAATAAMATTTQLPAATAVPVEQLAAYDTMTTAFSLPYMVLVEPDAADVVFRSKNACALWNDPTTQQQQGLTAPRSFDNIGAIQRTIAEIATEGFVTATATVEPRTARAITVTLSGTSSAVLTDRSRVLRQYYEIGVDHVGIDTFQLLDAHGELLAPIAAQLDAIAEYTSVTIFVTKVLDPALRPQNPGPIELEDIWKPYHILAYGDLDSIAFAKTRLALLIDDLNGLHIDRMLVPLSLHTLLAGRDQISFQKVTQDTNTKLYTPTLFPCVHSSLDENHARRDYDEIYIAGLEADVDRARDAIEELKRKVPVYSKDFVVPFAKIDYLLLHALDKLEDFSRRNGAFIQFPYLGAARSIVRVQCSSHIFVENTIRAVAKLICDIYSAGYWIHEGRADNDGFLIQPKTLPPTAEMRTSLERIASTSGTDVSFLRGTFDVLGDTEATKSAVSQIRGLPFWPSEHHQVRFRLELSVDQREFIAGKKNGKLNRIMSTAHVWIKFEPFTEYNFFVDLVASNYAAALYGMQLLEEELPAEISFYIPEVYHRNIIGPSGQQIQALMRKYNVFVKFSNAYEQATDVVVANGGGSVATMVDNVVVRCPSKNKENLEPAKKEILEVVRYLEHGMGVPGSGQPPQQLPQAMQSHNHHSHPGHVGRNGGQRRGDHRGGDQRGDHYRGDRRGPAGGHYHSASSGDISTDSYVPSHERDRERRV
ncbi:uncharacterized protein V1518DRAFT_411179 [Limtongia smithiae]|uniref:uncharacterized protein n=1 Tax=Limtongia smithiae TaxID=1125753 RepID=UPI0034CFD000